MRTLLLAGAAVASLAGPSAVFAADIYEPAPGYTQAPPMYQPPPPDYGPPPRAYRPAPRYGYAQPDYGPQPGYAPPLQAYGPPPAVAYDDDDDEIAPPRVYRERPVYAQRPRYDCWWEWGQRRCAPRRGW